MMKYLYKYIGLLIVCLLAQNVWAQCNCTIDIVPINDCCGQVFVTLDPNCPTTHLSQITISSNQLSQVTGEIASFNLAPSLAANLNSQSITGNTFLDVQLTPPFTLPLGINYYLGEICFQNVNNNLSVVTSEVSIYDGNNLVCQEFVEFFANCPTPPLPEDFKKIYGTADDELPNRIISTVDAIWIAGRKEINGEYRGSVSKFDLAGNFQCEYYYSIESEFYDLAEDPNTGNIIVVGQTLPIFSNGSFQNNQSMVLVIDRFCGGLLQRRLYNQNGRETLNRVIVHPNPVDPDYPIYVLGAENPTSTPSSFDSPVLFNFSSTLSFHWKSNYPEINGIELEAYRGLIPLSNGRLVVLGNGSVNNPGLIMEVDGFGGPTNEIYVDDLIDFYDGMEDPSGDFIIVGQNFGTNTAIAMAFDPSWNQLGGIQYLNMDNFNDIGRDSFGAYYTTATSKINNNENYVHKWEYISPGIFNPIWDKYLIDGASDFTNPRIYVSDLWDKIFYTDARLNHPAGLGDYDLFISETNLDYNCNCEVIDPQPILGYAPPQSTFQTLGNYLLEPANNPHPGVFGSMGTCSLFCADSCDVDLTCSIDCFTANFTATPNSGSGPYFYEWDEDCDGLFEASGSSNMHQVVHPPMPSSQTHTICVRVTDANGVACEEMKTYVVEDLTPPLLACPLNQTLCTDPGLCSATFQIPLTVADNCDPNPVVTCVLSGATLGDETTTDFNYGLTNITCTATDASGNSVSCSFTVWVMDCEDPVITCPQNVYATADVCNGGINLTLPPPSSTDNCPNVTETCSHVSGDFFPCGTTTVTCTAVDQDGNVDSCTYDVIVDCDCAEVGVASLACDPNDPNLYHFTVTMNGLSGSVSPWSACNTNVVANMPGITVSNVTTTWLGSAATMTGTIDYTGTCPSDILLTATMDCICSNGTPFNCSKDFSIPAVCCRTVSIDDASICQDAGQNLNVPLIGCADLCDVQQVKWYLANGPCPPASTAWGAPFQTSQSCQDLLIDPSQFSGEICVYAEVITSSSTDPCGNLFTSNVATINICEPIQVNVSSSQTHCFDGTPYVPNVLTATVNNGNTNCTYTIQWFENGTLIPGAASSTYQPPVLSIPAGSTACNMQWTYTATVTPVECDPVSSSAIIQLDNDDAPLGSLYLDPIEPLPLCPGEDITLRYDDACAGDPAEWEWYKKTAGGTYTHLTNQGNMNPLYNTNRLYSDTYYKIEKTNGVCPTDEIEIFIPVQDQITASIQAVPTPICDPTTVKLVLTFAPNLTVPNNYTIEWYRDGNLITTGTAQVSPISYTYVPSNGDIRGNYYAVISNNSCPGSVKTNVEVIEAPCHLEIAGPCYRCDNEIVQLDAIITNPIQGASCSYQWFDNGVAIPGATGTSLMVQPNQFGPFRFDCTCIIGGATCVKSETFDLLQCFCPDADGDSVCNAEDQCPGEDDTIDANGDGIPDCLLDPLACDPLNFTNAPTGLFVNQTISNGTKTQLLWDHYSDAADGCILRGGAIDALDINSNFIQNPGQVLIEGNAINGLPNGFDYSAPLAANASFNLFNPNTYPSANQGNLLPGEFYKWQVRCGCVIDPSLPLPDRLALGNVHLSPWSNFSLFTNLNLSPQIGSEDVSEWHEMNNGFIVYPNPFKDELIISLTENDHEWDRLDFYNALGQLIHSVDTMNENQLIRISTEDWNKGIYFIQANSTTEKINQKLIKY